MNVTVLEPIPDAAIGVSAAGAALRLRGIRKSFGEHAVLQDIDALLDRLLQLAAEHLRPRGEGLWHGPGDRKHLRARRFPCAPIPRG